MMNRMTSVLENISPRTSDAKEEFGDWQTGLRFAVEVCRYLKDCGVCPKVIVEPTCGRGNFIKAALSVFDSVELVVGIEVFKPYLEEAEDFLSSYSIQQGVQYKLFLSDIFSFDFKSLYALIGNRPLLILGNLPWVTNSGLGRVNSSNLPNKSNYKKLKGIEAITGKGNFDIAESICNLLLRSLGNLPHAYMALLVKNSVIRNIVQRQNGPEAYPICQIKQLGFDANKEFGVSVSASLLFARLGENPENFCSVSDFYSKSFISKFGWRGHSFVSNLLTYEQTKSIDGRSPLVWRSGLKHDCAKVMELTYSAHHYENGFHEPVLIEEANVFPFLKSSDIGNGYVEWECRKFVVLPQRSVKENTDTLKLSSPLTYTYLLKYSSLLDGRKSIIYKNKSRFCVFGLGAYSFQKYKVVVSSLYKSMRFSLVPPIGGKTVLLDDTCYLLGFDNYLYAAITLSILNSDYVQRFLQTICFSDAKRVVSRDLLMRIDLLQAVNQIKGDAFSPAEIDAYKSWLQSQLAPSQPLLF